MAVTLGSSSAPQVLTQYFDALFSTSLANYSKKLRDAIGATNAFFFEMIRGEMYVSKPGGTDMRVPLMYALSSMDWYDGYDELAAVPTDGVTDAIYQWRQAATPVMYSIKELKQNKQRLISLVETKMKQAEMGIQEGFAQALLWGAKPSGGNLTDAPTSPVNGASGIDPLPRMIAYDPTASMSIGGLDQNLYTWWRNKTKTSSATTYDAFILEMFNIFNTTALGTGGAPKLFLVDQITYELFQHAFFQKYRIINTDINYPFQNFMFNNCKVVMDDKVPDAAGNSTSAATHGTGYLINPQFLELDYEEDSDFQMLKDENGKTFQKPVNGDSRLGHIAWMGNTSVSNRRKQGVIGNIARTMT